MDLDQDNLSLEDRQRLLTEASDDYVLGKTDHQKLKQAESKYRVDYASATLELAGIRQQIKYEFKRLKTFAAKVLHLESKLERK
jgi:hypothetical protein